MSFKEMNLKKEYRSKSDNVIKDFFIPVLNRANMYKRAVGFFSSTALAEISKGISGLILNGGTIELVASPYLSEEDVEAIKKGYKDRNSIIKDALLNSLVEPRDEYESDRLNLLTELIARKKLDIKIALLEDNSEYGMFHEKMGLLVDSYGNKIAFSGSMNETTTAMKVNYESFDVFCSWKNEDEKERVHCKENAFEAIWNNIEPNIEVIEFPEVKEYILKKYKKSKLNMNIDEQEVIAVDEKLSLIEFNTNQYPKMPNGVDLYEYQKDAINEWEAQGFSGIFDMATGTGKTFTGLGAIVNLTQKVKNKLAVFIVCPYQHLVEQWVEDIVKFNIKPIIGYSASSQKNWRKLLEDAILDQKLKVKNREFFCFVSTNATFASKYVQTQIRKMRGHALLVIDEAHNFGAEYLSITLTDKFQFRLALSATIERHNDEEGTQKLYKYFGDKCIEYPLETAIRENKLTKYKYYPIITTLNEYELEKYTELSYEISKCVIKGKDGLIKLNERGKRLALERARIVAGAEDKIQKLEQYIRPYIHDKHILVYCGAARILKEFQDVSDTDDEDIRQIDAVTDILGNKLNMKVSQFTSKEDSAEREILKKEFSEGENLQALIAIKCLDEGVNIPKIKLAFILASTTNPKEYIQRRGRVLRLAKGKEFAVIYDFVTLPRQLDMVHSLTEQQMNKDITLVKNELNRIQEFSSIAINMIESETVINTIKEAYCIEESYISFEEEFIYE